MNPSRWQVGGRSTNLNLNYATRLFGEDIRLWKGLQTIAAISIPGCVPEVLSVADYSIRQAISSDIPALMALDHGYSTDHVWQMSFERGSDQVGVNFREVRLPRPMRVSYPRDPERLADEWTHKAVILIAEADGYPLGYLAIVDGPAQNMAWITDLVVSLRHRRQGIATRLLGAAREWCRERGMERVFVEMQSKNYPALKLLRKSGFVFAGYSDSFYPDQDIALFFSTELY